MMKLKDCIKIGVGVWIGWTVMDMCDKVAGMTFDAIKIYGEIKETKDDENCKDNV